MAGLRDRDASVLTARARLALHRYVRHFAGLPKRTRDLARLREIISDLQDLQDQLDPMIGRIQVPSVGEEIAALAAFQAFLQAEMTETQTVLRHCGRLALSEALGQVADELHRAWQAEVLSEDRPLRRPGLLRRLIGAADEVLDGLMAVGHANLPPEHEERVARVARALVRWQDELAASEAARAALSQGELRLRLLTRAHDLFRQYREQLSGAHAHRDLRAIAVLCDRADEVERQLTELDQPLLDEDFHRELAWLRDVLVAMCRTFDQVNAALVEGP